MTTAIIRSPFRRSLERVRVNTIALAAASYDLAGLATLRGAVEDQRGFDAGAQDA